MRNMPNGSIRVTVMTSIGSLGHQATGNQTRRHDPLLFIIHGDKGQTYNGETLFADDCECAARL